MSWKKLRLDDIKAPEKYALCGGPFGSKLVSKDYVPEGVPVIRGVNLSGDSRFSFEDFVFVSEEKANELLPNNAHPGDLVFTQRGTLGQVGIIPKNCGYDRFVISQSQMKLRVDETKADPLFLYYQFRLPETIQTIENLAFSSGVPHINLAILRDFKVMLPPLHIQKKIATVLSAYDDLIENNVHRIKILEEISRSLFREWFVHFHYPGCENQKLVESELGQIPEGWKVASLKELVDFERGVEPGSKNYLKQYEEETLPFLRVGDLGHRESSIFVKNELSKGKVLDKTDIAITLDGTIGIVKTGLKGCYSTGIRKVIIRNNDLLKPSFLYFLLKSDHIQSIIKAHAKGTTILHAGSSIDYMDFVLPENSMMERFDEIVESMMNHRQILLDKNSNLSNTRDILMHRLISGEINPNRISVNISGD